MPRPRKVRRIECRPRSNYFKPCGIPLRDLAEVYIGLENLEAIRLVDIENLNMEAASERMRVSRHTFGRVLAEGRRAVAEALVNGFALRIEGGSFAHGEGDRRAFVPGGRKPTQYCRIETGEMPDFAGYTKERSKMRIAVTSEGPGPDARVDPRFGRAAGFAVVDTENMKYEYIDNGESQVRAKGAGINAAERIAAFDVSVLLTGFVGPNAFSALSAAGIRVGQDMEGMTVAQAVERYLSGQVVYAERPNK